MTKRIAAIVFIFLCTSAAWAVLGGTVFYRTYSSEESLRDRVVSTWGAPQVQQPPSAEYYRTETKKEETIVDGKHVISSSDRVHTIPLPLESSRVDVGFGLEHRQKGLLWYSTYKVDFSGTYGFQNPSNQEQKVYFRLRFPAERAIYDGLVFTLDGRLLEVANSGEFATAAASVPPNSTSLLQIKYLSQGLDSWRYKLGGDVAQVRDFRLTVNTDFDGFDFPENTLSPTDKTRNASGWNLRWDYKNLVSGFDIGLAMPQKLQPGPLAGRISYFAPVSLFFFFFLMLIITTLRNIELHPMNYFFLAAAFFSFHLLLAYLADHISIHLAFLICSAVSIFLVVSYLRLVVGLQFAVREAGLAQFIYLVLFSYAFFFEGFTGLTITIGSILTLFVVMQITGRQRWSERFSSNPARPGSLAGSRS